MQLFKSLFSTWRKKRAPIVTCVELSVDGFIVLKSDNASEAIRWSDVESIITYKIDCYGYDKILLAFESQGHEFLVHFSEEVVGFDKLIVVMNRAFPSIDPEWYYHVSLPPFKENFTVIFQRTREVQSHPQLT
jgi:hypothetical protein